MDGCLVHASRMAWNGVRHRDALRCLAKVPFILPGAVGYVAGLTRLAFWRVALATLAGIVPISVLLVRLGEKQTAASGDTVLLAVLALGGVTLIPLAVRTLRPQRPG